MCLFFQLSSSQKQYAGLCKSNYNLKEEIAKLEGKDILYSGLLSATQDELDVVKQEKYRLMNVEADYNQAKAANLQTRVHNKELITILEDLQFDYTKLKEDYK